MKSKQTLVFAILFLTALACGLAPAQAAPAGAGACAGQAQSLAAPVPAAAPAGLSAVAIPAPFPTALDMAKTSGPGLECISFCSIALCPQGTTCGPSPGGGCGCQPDGGGILGSGN